jgi:hypothetical protein
MSDDELGRFSEGFAMWRQILGAVAPDDRLKIFANAASEVAGYVAKGLDKVAAADELTDMAIGCGLDDTDAVQATIVEAFKNGHDADASDAPQGDEQAPHGLNVWNAGRDFELPSPRGWLLGNSFCREFLSSLLVMAASAKPRCVSCRRWRLPPAAI